MNVEKAIKILRRYYFVDKLEDGNYRLGIGRRPDKWDDILTPDQLTRRAKIWTSDGRGSIKKNVKHFDHRGNRQRTKRAIHHEEYDKFPNNDKIYKEDIWMWD